MIMAMRALVVPFVLGLSSALAQAPSPQDVARVRAIAVGLAHVAQTREPRLDSNQPDSAIDVERELPRCAERRNRIVSEIAALGEHEWAGVYYQGDHLGVNVTLTIAPGAGATYTWTGCMGTYDLNYGDVVSVSPEGIELKLAFDPGMNKRSHQAFKPHHYMSSRWVPVRWGGERFLVPDCQLIPFCNDVNGGGQFFPYPRRRIGKSSPFMESWQRPEGLPDVPALFAPFLLREPLAAAIRECAERKVIGTFTGGDTVEYEVSATVDQGSAAGLLPGMILHAVEPGRSGEGQVVAVEPTQATVEFRFALYVASDEERNVPKPGWKLSTRNAHGR